MLTILKITNNYTNDSLWNLMQHVSLQVKIDYALASCDLACNYAAVPPMCFLAQLTQLSWNDG